MLIHKSFLITALFDAWILIINHFLSRCCYWRHYIERWFHGMILALLWGLLLLIFFTEEIISLRVCWLKVGWVLMHELLSIYPIMARLWWENLKANWVGMLLEPAVLLPPSRSLGRNGTLGLLKALIFPPGIPITPGPPTAVKVETCLSLLRCRRVFSPYRLWTVIGAHSSRGLIASVLEGPCFALIMGSDDDLLSVACCLLKEARDRVRSFVEARVHLLPAIFDPSACKIVACVAPR
jgi:hypothetical protein